MVYPLLDSKVDFPQTVSLQSGISTLNESAVLWKAIRQSTMKLKNASWSQPPSTNGRHPPVAGNRHLLSSCRIVLSFKKHFPKDLPWSLLPGTRKVTESSNWAV